LKKDQYNRLRIQERKRLHYMLQTTEIFYKDGRIEKTLGSSSDCDLVVSDASVDALHLKISNTPDGNFVIVDQNTTNGTYVRGNKVEKILVENNEIIQVGHHPVDMRWVAMMFEDEQDVSISQSGTMIFSSSLTIGRDAPADIIVDFPEISRKHCKLQLTPEGSVLIEDLNSTNGTWMNGERIDGVTSLKGNVLAFGSYKVSRWQLQSWKRRLRLQLEKSPVEQEFITNTLQGDGVLHIGRDPSSGIVIDHPSVSWNHAKITIESQKWTIQDFNSTNGVFVNNKRVKKSVIDIHSDIRIGQVSINLGAQMITKPEDLKREVRVDVYKVSRKLKNGNTILDDISLSIYPKEMVALMGPSGAGKTSLLELITGQVLPSDGDILLNGVSLKENWDEFRYLIGYVPQEDIMHRDLTIYEVLYHNAKMKLPCDIPDKAVQATVENLLSKMGLAHIKDSLIGGERIRGISGGQRKRVNIAIELITEPSLLFLDEPTSGLDAVSTLEVLRILRTLADDGKTIIMTIHQPRIEAFRLMDHVILLTKGGKLSFYGPAMPDSAKYFEDNSGIKRQPMTNPADYVLDVLENKMSLSQKKPDEWKKLYRDSDYYQRFIIGRFGEKIPSSDSYVKHRRSFFRQYRNMFQRYCKRKVRDRMALLIQMTQTPIIALSLGWLFWQDGYAMETKQAITAFKHEGLLNVIQLQNGIHATLFLIGAAAFWFGCSNVAREIVCDVPVYKRERRGTVGAFAYLFSIYSYQFILVAIQTLFLTVIVWFMLELTASLILGWGILLCVSLCGVSLGLMISAYSKTEIAAISIVPLILLPQLLFGGFIKLYGSLVTNGFQSNLADLMPLRWAFEALALLEYNSLQQVNEHVRDIENVIGFSNTSPLNPLVILLTMSVLFFCLTWVKLNQIKGYQR
jgi:ABC transport system ATP-binding/permease protein